MPAAGRFIGIAGVIGALPALLGCASGGSLDVEALPSPTTGVEAVATVERTGPPTFAPQPTEDPNAPPPTPNPLVTEILADGVVTFAEYERAVLAHMQCLRENGLVHGQPVWNPNAGGYPRWNYSVEVPPLEPGQEDFSETCFFEYEAAVQSQWVDQNRPSEEEKQRREKAVVDCVRGLGHEQVVSFAQAVGFVGEPSLSDEERLDVIECIDGSLAPGAE